MILSNCLRSLQGNLTGRLLDVLLVAIPLFLMPAECIGKDFNNLVIDYSSVSRVENGKLATSESFIFQVNNADGDWISEISIPYSLNQKIENLEAWITDRTGQVVRKLKKKDIVDKSAIRAGTLYEDNFVKTFDLKHNTYPYQVHYHYTIVSSEFILINYWFPRIFRYTPTLKASLQVEVPEDYKINILQNKCAEPEIKKKDGKLTYDWKVAAVFPLKNESFAPHALELYPKVIIAPEEFEYGGMGSTSDWISYGDWQCDLQEGMDVLPATTRQKIHTLTDGLETPEEKVKALYHFMQDNTRYINVAIDVGGLKPYPATYVAEKQYGDCKALSNYMQALLAEVGIASFYTNVYAGDIPVRLVKEFAGPQFNHVIVAVPMGNDTIWLETTSGINPCGYLGTFTQNRKVLVVKKAESKIVKTPALSPKDVLVKRLITYELNEDPVTTVKSVETLRGEAFEQWNYIDIHYQDDEKQKALSGHIRFKVFDIVNWKITRENRDATNIDLSYEIKVNNLIKKYDHSMIIPLPATDLPDIEKPEDREFPVSINYPVYSIDSIVFNLKGFDGYQLKLPESDTMTSRFGNYWIHASQFEDKVVVEKSFLLNRGEFGREVYEEFYTFLSNIRKRERKSAIIIRPN